VSDPSADRIARLALDRLLESSEDGFAEARHTLAFPRDQGFAVEDDEQTGDVFARATVADALCDVRHLAPDRVDPVLDREVAHLLACRDRDGVGGWRYFPALRELPPDADDLAQAMQVLLRCGRRDEVAANCERAIAAVLGDAHEDGGFETWILPAEDASAARQLERHWVAIAWGSGADVEVVANLLFALVLYDPERFADAIARGARFVLSRQRSDGSWPSTWYHGPFYGTYVCTRLLATVAPEAEALSRAASFLASHAAGAHWGVAAEADPLSTSLALLALAYVAHAGGSVTLDASTVPAALGLLERAAAAPPPIPFIRMELGRPTGRPWAVLSYGSATVTAAYVAKAATAWARMLTAG
jgi:squalene-hopene/tetraprenyl-beta-curcumene cyclase